MNKTVVIIGAGPAGLAAGYELLKQKSGYEVVILEQTDQIGGLSQTVNYKGNRMDIGGHRFFSKEEKIMNWWHDLFPVYERPIDHEDHYFMVRNRFSHILHNSHLFDYPLSLNGGTMAKLGVGSLMRMGASYTRSRLQPIMPEESLEDFFINRFGKELYHTFFKDYTEKVWGLPCRKISAEWGNQRVKGLSVSKAIRNAIVSPFRDRGDWLQKNVETSLVERFIYPKYGPGQLYEHLAHKIEQMGGKIYKNHTTVAFDLHNGHIEKVRVRTNEGERQISCHAVLSSMPVKDLVTALKPILPSHAVAIGERLAYRDFMTVGLLLKGLTVPGHHPLPLDQWIYIQEPHVKVGRLQIFNNWSPYMVQNTQQAWVGLEYFCQEGDAWWTQGNDRILETALDEISTLGLARKEDFIDGTVVRMPKAYPCYFGAYDHFENLRPALDAIPNLIPIGRNGMHRYNNMDHSIMTAFLAVDVLTGKCKDKREVWNVNTEKSYHEEKKIG